MVDDMLSQMNLPPGFRFFPTDEELLVQYLCKKLDDWVLCRIYKKNPSKRSLSASEVESREYSHASSPSSSSQYDGVLESLEQIDDRFANLPRMDSLKLNLQNLGSGNFDWATLAGLNPQSEFVQAQQIQANRNVV